MFSLRAFNIETVLIGDQVASKEGALIQIRFQWWRDAVDAVFQGQASPKAKHPVVLALKSVIEQQQQQQQDNGKMPRIKK